MYVIVTVDPTTKKITEIHSKNEISGLAVDHAKKILGVQALPFWHTTTTNRKPSTSYYSYLVEKIYPKSNATYIKKELVNKDTFVLVLEEDKKAILLDTRYDLYKIHYSANSGQYYLNIHIFEEI